MKKISGWLVVTLLWMLFVAYCIVEGTKHWKH
jgi:hypothetical protein